MNFGGSLTQDNRIRIITNAGIRYEGKLYEINQKERTIALQDVASFGSEDRRSDQIIPPMQVRYECIVFDAADIKDIRVLSKEEVQDYEVKSQQTPKQSPVQNSEPVTQPEVSNPPVAKTAFAQQEVKTEVSQPTIQKPAEDQTEPEKSSTKIEEKQEVDVEEQIQDQEKSSSQAQDLKSDKFVKYKTGDSSKFAYDVMEDKISEIEKLRQEARKNQQEKSNAQDEDDDEEDDFFDNKVSTSVNEKLDFKEDLREQNGHNVDTFGYNGRLRGNRRGRGRGGRGRGDFNNRGRGRGYGQTEDGHNYSYKRNYQDDNQTLYRRGGGAGGANRYENRYENRDDRYRHQGGSETRGYYSGRGNTRGGRNHERQNDREEYQGV